MRRAVAGFLALSVVLAIGLFFKAEAALKGEKVTYQQGGTKLQGYLVYEMCEVLEGGGSIANLDATAKKFLKYVEKFR